MVLKKRNFLKSGKQKRKEWEIRKKNKLFSFFDKKNPKKSRKVI